MTDKPSDAEIIMLAVELGVSVRTGKGAVKLTRAGLAKWGQSAQAADPLTYEQILALWSGEDQRGLRPVLGSKKVLAFARAIEAAHGIRGGQS